MFHKSGGPYIIKMHQLAAQHQSRATALQATGVAVHLSAALAHPVLQHLAETSPEGAASTRLLADAKGRLGLGYGTFAVQGGEVLVCHHPQHGVTLWADTRDVLQALLLRIQRQMPNPSAPALTPALAPALTPAPAPPMRYTLTCPGKLWTWQALGAPLPDTHHYFPLQDLAYLADHVAPWVVEIVGEEGCGGRQMVGALACQHGWNVLDTDVEPKHWPPVPEGGPTVAIVPPDFPRQYIPHMIVFVLTTPARRIAAQHTVHLETRTKGGVSVEQLFGCPAEQRQLLQPLPQGFSSMYD